MSPDPRRPIRTLLIDNDDSFTYNLFHQLAQVTGTPPTVVRNDAVEVLARLDDYDGIVISPGPGDPRVPADFGICAEVIRSSAVPLLGVCLGHQGLAAAYGAEVVRAPEPRHGRTSAILHDGEGLFRGIPSPVEMVRYHSLMVDDVPDALAVTAVAADDGVVMALRHRERPQWGVQFHPESIASPHGTRILENFVALIEERRDTGARGAPIVERAPADVSVRASARADAPAGVDSPARVDRSGGSGRVLRRELPLRTDAATLFDALWSGHDHAVWLDGNRPGDARSRFSIMGGANDAEARIATADVVAHTVTLHEWGSERTLRTGFFDWLEDELDAHRIAPIDGPVDSPLPGALGWVGWLGYELRAECGSSGARRSETPDAALLFLDRALVVDHEEARIHLLALVPEEAGAPASGDRDAEDWLERTVKAITAIDTSALDSAALDSLMTDSPMTGVGAALRPAASAPSLRARHSRPEYLALIRECQERIAAGETYEVCLTNTIDVGIDDAFDPLAAYLLLRAQNPAPFGAFLRLGGVSVLSTSPERFLRISAEGDVESSPIKGTRPRGRDGTEDAAIRAELAAAEKDRSENLMIVDLVRHDLGRTAEIGSVHVDGLFRVESYATVHQLVSTVRSRLRADATPVACVRAAFPPGSMTGAPKLRTMTIIDELEGAPRGVYSGAIGRFALDGSVDLSVVIRTLVVSPRGAAYGVGGAIVALSDPEDEYRETVVKAAPLLRLLGAEFPTG
ncbi:para-aminobenzoate synthetase [Microbacterium resistens]|uniref:aminodeoxychorismate synthase n=1 Tax=Microbacterium resistens TaxID=156977 RepID=A0ABU1SD94_9MICO|nr:aminodeoxychorismate synthase component I [Microbacterium resistens]MDR6867582.1 para-aminobenzoate synthetase [Microbacterium resistens]